MFKGQMLDFDKDRFAEVKATAKDGKYELVWRPQPRWDTGAMGRFFHGPVRKFVVAQLREKGVVTTEDQVKSDFKQMFGPKEERMRLDGKIVMEPKSTADYTYEEYWNVLTRIKEWCQSNLGCELPLQSEVD